MTIIPKALALAVGLVTAAGATWAASQSDYADCNSGDPDRSIKGCTRIIEDKRETAKNRTIAYAIRCSYYHDKRENDRALVDCTEAIKLDSKYAPAFFTRGIVYQAEGPLDLYRPARFQASAPVPRGEAPDLT